jgi:hypothetical protein
VPTVHGNLHAYIWNTQDSRKSLVCGGSTKHLHMTPKFKLFLSHRTCPNILSFRYVIHSTNQVINKSIRFFISRRIDRYVIVSCIPNIE